MAIMGGGDGKTLTEPSDRKPRRPMGVGGGRWAVGGAGGWVVRGEWRAVAGAAVPPFHIGTYLHLFHLKSANSQWFSC